MSRPTSKPSDSSSNRDVLRAVRQHNSSDTRPDSPRAQQWGSHLKHKKLRAVFVTCSSPRDLEAAEQVGGSGGQQQPKQQQQQLPEQPSVSSNNSSGGPMYKRKQSGPDLFGLAAAEGGEHGAGGQRLGDEEGMVDAEMCEVINLPPPAELTPAMEAWTRGKWLLGLLVLQSSSSLVLESYEALLREHLVITLFLTMLVGAGGNAGNQSAIKVIRGMATGSIKPTMAYFRRAMMHQVAVGLLLGGGLAVGGFLRVYITNGDVINSIAISLSLLLIVMTSVMAGTALPFVLSRAGVDPANAGTTIQVVMDCMGVVITCATCKLIFDQLALGVSV